MTLNYRLHDGREKFPIFSGAIPRNRPTFSAGAFCDSACIIHQTGRGKSGWTGGIVGVRGLLIASVSTGLVLGTDAAFAQDEETNVQNLPPVEIVAPPRTAARRETPRTATRRTTPRTPTRVASPSPPLYVYPTSPGASGSIEVDKIPASINAVDSNQIRRTHSPDIAVALQQYVPGLSINEVTGNPFQPDVQFRGFVASPLAGTPQGLAVYQNGVRINEAFSDIVNWDLIPTAAIRSAVVVPTIPRSASMRSVAPSICR